MLAYQTQGKGRPLVLLHAFPLSSVMWDSEIQKLSRDFYVIAPDLPGFGKSSFQKDVTMEFMAREVAVVLDRLNIKEPVIIAGLSMGGYVMLEFLKHFPERLCGLAFFATRATADTLTAKENRFKSIEAMERFGLEPFAKKAVKSQLGKTTQEKNPQLASQVLGIMASNTAETAIAAQRAMACRKDFSDLIKLIDKPVLIMAGEEDELAPPAEMRGMHECIKNSRFHVVPQAGHLINLEQPEVFHALFLDFLKTL